MPDDAIPDYEPLLAAYHRAFAAELEAMVASLPIRPGDRVLEMACGDGAYTGWLADRVDPGGSVVALDLLMGYLRKARAGLARAEGAGRARFVAGSIERLPFADGSFDHAWCAQSLFSLPEPVDAVRRMARVVRPGGTVAVLEDDTMHQVLLPWPVDLELAVRSAEWEAFREESDHPGKFYVGRRLLRGGAYLHTAEYSSPASGLRLGVPPRRLARAAPGDRPRSRPLLWAVGGREPAVRRHRDDYRPKPMLR